MVQMGWGMVHLTYFQIPLLLECHASERLLREIWDIPPHGHLPILSSED